MVKVHVDRNNKPSKTPSNYSYKLHFKRTTYEKYSDFEKRDYSLDQEKRPGLTPFDYYLLAEVRNELRGKKIGLFEKTEKEGQYYEEIYTTITPRHNFVIDRVLTMHIGLDHVRQLPLFDHDIELRWLTASQIDRLPTRLPKFAPYGGTQS